MPRLLTLVFMLHDDDTHEDFMRWKNLFKFFITFVDVISMTSVPTLTCSRLFWQWITKVTTIFNVNQFDKADGIT